MTADFGTWGGCFLPEGQLGRHVTGAWATCQVRRCRLGIPSIRFNQEERGLRVSGLQPGGCTGGKCGSSVLLEEAGPGAACDEKLHLKILPHFPQGGRDSEGHPRRGLLGGASPEGYGLSHRCGLRLGGR